jgi:hypothetical protein
MDRSRRAVKEMAQDTSGASTRGRAAGLVTLVLPESAGSYRLIVTVQDDAAGTTATTERVLTLAT